MNTKFVEQEIQKVIKWEFYTLDLSKNKSNNDINYIKYSKKFENELLIAINN